MRTQLLIVLFACLSLAYAADFSSGQYQGLSSDAKMTRLWSEITKDTTPDGWYSKLSFAGLFLEKMKPTFDSYTDDMPDGHRKYIHSVGSIAKAEFVTDPSSPYTGVFKGAKNVLLRISLAKAADPKSKPMENFLPGLGIKFLRDGVPSANLVAMKGLDGQDSWNIFKYDWSHHIAAPCSFALKLAAKKFEEATPHTGRIGIKTWADFDQNGNHVSKPVAPFKIYFRPASAVKNMFPDSYQDEFTKQLAKIPAGTAIYDIYAVPEPHADAVKIGTVRSTSKFTTSRFADKDLFFQHNYIEDDLKQRPDWLKAVKADPPVPSKLV